MRMELAEWQSCGQVQSLEIVSKKWELANQEKREKDFRPKRESLHLK